MSRLPEIIRPAYIMLLVIFNGLILIAIDLIITSIIDKNCSQEELLTRANFIEKLLLTLLAIFNASHFLGFVYFKMRLKGQKITEESGYHIE